MPLVAGGEIHRSGDELTYAETLEQRGKRQVFAERHQVHLVDGIGDLALVVDCHHGIVVAAAGSSRTALLADDAGDQHLAVAQHVAQRRQRVRTLGEQERHRRFRPQDQPRLGMALFRRLCRYPQQRCEDAVAHRGVPFLTEIDGGLDDANVDRAGGRLGRDGKPEIAEADVSGDKDDEQGKA